MSDWADTAKLRQEISDAWHLADLRKAEAEQLRTELEASRHELVGAKKSARAQARTIESLQQQREHLHVQRDQWIEARNTLESERAANARLTEELAAGREREARMQWQPIETAPKDGSYLLVSNGHGVWVARFEPVYQSGWKPPSPWQSMMLNHDHIPSAKRNGSPTHWMPLPTPPSAAPDEGAQG